MAQSSKALFRATKPKSSANQATLADFPKMVPPDTRDPLDYDPTPHEATEAVLAEEKPFILAHGNHVWETAVGGGHIATVLQRHGFQVSGNDVADRGWPGVELKSFYEFEKPVSDIQFTNPPYCEINARDGSGRWLWHSLSLGIPYIALLLNADWPAARINGMDRLFREHPPSIEYLCCWKIDFRGGGSPPQRNSWFVWDVNRPALGADTWVRKRLFKDVPDKRQGVLL